MGRWLTVRVVAWGLRGGIDDGEMERVLRNCFPHRDSGWRREIIGDAHLLNDRKRVKRDHKAWRKLDA